MLFILYIRSFLYRFMNKLFYTSEFTSENKSNQNKYVLSNTPYCFSTVKQWVGVACVILILCKAYISFVLQSEGTYPYGSSASLSVDTEMLFDTPSSNRCLLRRHFVVFGALFKGSSYLNRVLYLASDVLACSLAILLKLINIERNSHK